MDDLIPVLKSASWPAVVLAAVWAVWYLSHKKDLDRERLREELEDAEKKYKEAIYNNSPFDVLSTLLARVRDAQRRYDNR